MQQVELHTVCWWQANYNDSVTVWCQLRHGKTKAATKEPYLTMFVKKYCLIYVILGGSEFNGRS